PISVREITPRTPDEFLGVTVSTTEVVHFSGAPSTAVRLTDGRKTLAYSGDTQWVDVLHKVADGADLFICECYDYSRELTGHINWAKLREKLPQLKARKIMLTHMNPSMLAKHEELRASGVLLAEDGLVIDV